MKTILSKTKLFAFLTVISVALLFNGCSKDDESDSSNTLLEQLDGTTWKFVNIEDIYYLKFNKNLFAPVEFYYSDYRYTDCFDDIKAVDYDFEVVTNSKDGFEIFINWNTYESEKWTFLVSGDNMTWKKAWKDGHYTGTDIYTLTKSNDDVNKLIICD